MKPSEIIEMRDQLSDQMNGAFYGGNFRMNTDSQELADWLIQNEWVKGVPDDNID